ncbi:MAG: restriction endonuclease subunit S, partial [Hoeflea sp.]|nr:restriction endonuclease subunit S [Hoeflea sp.]
GYKQTEVGVIPEDWDLQRMSSLTSLPIQNGVFNEPARKGRGCKLINVGDLYVVTPIDIQPLELFDANKVEVSRFGVFHGDIFFTRSSLTPDGIAYCNIYEKRQDVDVVFDCHIIRVRPNTKKIDPFFLFRYCTTYSARKYLVEHAKTTTMTTIDQSVIANTPVPVPPLREQHAIAAALSDVDSLLAKLDQLIAKKRDLKQAAMQQLLTGQTRLPGFHGEWAVKRLGDLFEITSSKRVFQSEWKSDGIPFYRARELAVLGEKGRVDNDLFITKSLYESFKNAHGVPEVGDMLVTGVGTLGKVYVVPDEREFYFKDGNIIWFKIDGKLSADFLRQLYFTKVVLKQITDASAGTTVGTYTITGAKKTEIPFPSLAEQTAIVAVLTEMDTELSVLERRRDKTRALKQGMMQELLTGRIRLV